MSKKLKRNRKTIEVKSASVSRIVSPISIMLDGVIERAVQWMSRLIGKEEGGTALPKSEEAEITTAGLSGSAWIFGCSAGAAGEIAATYDEEEGANFNNNPSAEPVGEDEVDGIYYSNPLAASMKGVDCKTTAGAIDDYWTDYKSDLPDPYTGSGAGGAEPL